MIQYYNASGELCPLNGYENYYVTHKLDGCDTMSFCVNTSLPVYQELYEECRIVANNNLWLVKKIDDDEFQCELDFDFLKQDLFVDYESTTRTVGEVLEDFLPTNEWTILNKNIVSIKRTISFDFCTPYDIIYECMNTYDVYFVWNMLDKRLTLYTTDYMQSAGEYLTSELNLTKLSFNGDTSDFATRLYAFGSEGMTMESATVNGQAYGKTYVENNQYSEKLVCAYWSDERYTVPDDLYEAAVEKLADLSFPVRSYECTVLDLAKISDDYSFLDFSMHKKITLIDIERGIKVEHHIVEYTEYPDEPSNNKITLSCVPSTISTRITGISNDTSDLLDSQYNLIVQTLQDSIDEATNKITGNKGGYVRIVFNEEGEPEELLILEDSPEISVATKLWRWNASGLGFLQNDTGNAYQYGTAEIALTSDGLIVAKRIASGNIYGCNMYAGKILGGEAYLGVAMNTSYNQNNDIDTDQESLLITDLQKNAVFKSYQDSNGDWTVEIADFTVKGTYFYSEGMQIHSQDNSGDSEAGYIVISTPQGTGDKNYYKGTSMTMGLWQNTSYTIFSDTENYSIGYVIESNTSSSKSCLLGGLYMQPYDKGADDNADTNQWYKAKLSLGYGSFNSDATASWTRPYFRVSGVYSIPDGDSNSISAWVETKQKSSGEYSHLILAPTGRVYLQAFSNNAYYNSAASSSSNYKDGTIVFAFHNYDEDSEADIYALRTCDEGVNQKRRYYLGTPGYGYDRLYFNTHSSATQGIYITDGQTEDEDGNTTWNSMLLIGRRYYSESDSSTSHYYYQIGHTSDTMHYMAQGGTDGLCFEVSTNLHYNTTTMSSDGSILQNIFLFGRYSSGGSSSGGSQYYLGSGAILHTTASELGGTLHAVYIKEGTGLLCFGNTSYTASQT